ncbi:23S rRNA pseudouridine(2604) synthase RluF [Parabacteroides sp. PF5-6]|uniref:23S rRNA pseudouridine(2604) synthase RluF n=1 Tax=Parabacteroides sp. PF5-6 TaxID=1742403 RepID=UPI0024059772|nr:23S rRNA pseudouridine(2604) synthase RluF [Parabacteroides sp. PF5-6]
MQIRINKYISESGYCSRREADKYIEQGHVTIDGRRAEVGSQVAAGQVVKVFGETITNLFTPIILAYNKPVGVVSTTDRQERDNIIDAVGYPERIFPIGRLDKDSQGLILLTNDGNIVNKILRVNNNHDKEYAVTVNRPVTADFIQRMQGGVPILGVVTRKCELTQTGPNSFTIVLRQGLNRQIRRMCEYLGYEVVKLQRTRVMHIPLGKLKIGQYRELTSAESDTLYKAIASSVKTEEASAKKKKPTASNAAKSSSKPTAAKSASKSSSKPAEKKPFAPKGPYKTSPSSPKKSGKSSAHNTSFKPRGKGQRRSG